MPRASVTAKPKIRLPNWLGAADGLRRAPERKLPKMLATPMAAPAIPKQAMPAPMNFAASASILMSFQATGGFRRGIRRDWGLVGRVDRVVEIHARQDRKDIGLNRADEKLEAGDGDRHAERQDGGGPAERAQARNHHHHEAGKDLEGDVTGENVAEQTNRQADRTREEGDDLDRRHDGKDVARHAGGYEKLEEFRTVLDEAVDDDGDEHQHRQGEGDDDVAGDGEEIRHHAEHVGHEDEGEERKHQREELHAGGARRASYHSGDEF